jgi:hypothetical protein
VRRNERKETWVATDMVISQYYSRTFTETYFIRRNTRLGRDVFHSPAMISKCSDSATFFNIDLVAADQRKGRDLHRYFQIQILYRDKFL